MMKHFILRSSLTAMQINFKRKGNEDSIEILFISFCLLMVDKAVKETDETDKVRK